MILFLRGARIFFAVDLLTTEIAEIFAEGHRVKTTFLINS